MTVVLLIAAWIVLSVPLAIIVGRILHNLDAARRSTPTPARQTIARDRAGSPRGDEGHTGPSTGAATG